MIAGLPALIAAALLEDLGAAGDITSAYLIEPAATATAQIVVRKAGMVAGLAVITETFCQVDPSITVQLHVQDGAALTAGQTIATITGNTQSILIGERTALNLLSYTSGIATFTKAFADAVTGTKARIADTRKILPGFRALSKYAVRMSGGINHRFGLYDAVLIKDNHLALCGMDLVSAVAKIRSQLGHMHKICVEVDTLAQFQQAQVAKPDVILCDNFTPELLRQAVQQNQNNIILEASGGMNLSNVRSFAETGVDIISIGALTHSAPTLDFGLDIA